jgi:hypothetical protein
MEGVEHRRLAPVPPPAGSPPGPPPRTPPEGVSTAPCEDETPKYLAVARAARDGLASAKAAAAENFGGDVDDERAASILEEAEERLRRAARSRAAANCRAPPRFRAGSAREPEIRRRLDF